MTIRSSLHEIYQKDIVSLKVEGRAAGGLKTILKMSANNEAEQPCVLRRLPLRTLFL